MIIPAMKEKRPWIDKTWSRQKKIKKANPVKLTCPH
jgi:hypothetical protein